MRNKNSLKNSLFIKFLLIKFSLFYVLFLETYSQQYDTIKYIGNIIVNVEFHHGLLPLAKGVHNIQILRANREHPEMADNFGWTYNHAPMIAYWNNTFIVAYISDPIGEHIPPSHTMYCISKDGYNWSKPDVLFPTYKIPDGTTKEGVTGVAKDLYAVMHQRMVFYIAKNNKLLATGYYGICLNSDDDPNDGKGIGRVVREIYSDFSLGPIYFIRYNKNWNEKNTYYPFYKRSKDKEFIKSCEELLSNPLMMQQWVEEADRDDPLIPLKKQYKAFSFYHLKDGRVVGLWKNALTSISIDNGKTWLYNPLRAPGFVNGNAKIWGQQTSDGKYAIVYNPSEFRWPLAVSVSDDGLNYYNLLLVNGEISQARYGGKFKQYGPQYVRGILEGNGTPPDGNLWITYSMNKEDIWVSRINIPITDTENNDVNDNFNNFKDINELKDWNIFSPLWAQVKIERYGSLNCLVLNDADKYDYSKIERLFPESLKGEIEFEIVPFQNNFGNLQIELSDKFGNPAIRIIFDSTGFLLVKDGYRYSKILTYKKEEKYKINIEFDVKNRAYTLYVNDQKKLYNKMFFAPVKSLCRIAFRTGNVRRYPNPDSPAIHQFDMPGAGERISNAKYAILYFKTLTKEKYGNE